MGLIWILIQQWDNWKLSGYDINELVFKNFLLLKSSNIHKKQYMNSHVPITQLQQLSTIPIFPPYSTTF